MRSGQITAGRQAFSPLSEALTASLTPRAADCLQGRRHYMFSPLHCMTDYLKRRRCSQQPFASTCRDVCPFATAGCHALQHPGLRVTTGMSGTSAASSIPVSSKRTDSLTVSGYPRQWRRQIFIRLTHRHIYDRHILTKRRVSPRHSGLSDHQHRRNIPMVEAYPPVPPTSGSCDFYHHQIPELMGMR